MYLFPGNGDGGESEDEVGDVSGGGPGTRSCTYQSQGWAGVSSIGGGGNGNSTGLGMFSGKDGVEVSREFWADG